MNFCSHYSDVSEYVTYFAICIMQNSKGIMDIEICSVKFLDMAISYKKTYKQFVNLLNLIIEHHKFRLDEARQ